MKPLWEFDASVSSIRNLHVTHDHIVITSQDDGVTVLNHECQYQRLIQPDGTLHEVELASEVLATCNTEWTIQVFDLNTGSRSHSLTASEGHVYGALSLSENPRLLASGSSTGSVLIWDLADPNPTQKVLSGHEGYVYMVQFYAELLVSVDWNHNVRVWDVKEGICLNVLNGHAETVTNITFSDDGLILVTSDVTGVIKVWSLISGSCIITLSGHNVHVSGLQFTPESLISRDKHGKLCFWSRSSWKLERTISAHEGWCSSAIPTPRGKLVTTGLDRRLRVWNISSTDEKPLLDIALDGVLYTKAIDNHIVTLCIPGKALGAPLIGKAFEIQVWDMDEIESLCRGSEQ